MCFSHGFKFQSFEYFWNFQPEPWGNSIQFDGCIFFRLGWNHHLDTWIRLFYGWFSCFPFFCDLVVKHGSWVAYLQVVEAQLFFWTMHLQKLVEDEPIFDPYVCQLNLKPPPRFSQENNAKVGRILTRKGACLLYSPHLHPVKKGHLKQETSEKKKHTQRNFVQGLMFDESSRCPIQGTIGCTPNSIPMVFIVFSRDSWGL